jgi:hypothetical protein
MTYQPYLIANFATGFDRERQPWLLPDDAQQTLLDGYVYRGVWQKRDGYDQFADGERGGFPYTESRMIHTVKITANESANSSRTTFTFTIPASLLSPNPIQPLRRGGFRALDFTGAVQTQIIQDDGVGGTLAGSNGVINSTLNYTTYLATPQSVTFTAPPASGDVITLQIDVHQGLPVMGVMNFYTESNIKQLIVADTKYVNTYNPASNRLDDISPVVPLSGANYNFFTWTNYDAPNDTPRLLFVNNKNPVQRYDGTTVSPYPIYTNTGAPVSGATYFTPTTTSAGPYAWATPVAVLPGSVTITESTDSKTVTDDSFGNLIGDGSGTIDYLTGVASVTFNGALTAGETINISYTPMTDPIDTALHIFQFKDRLVVLAPTIGGVFQGKVILVSGFGRYGDVFAQGGILPSTDTVYVAGAGLIKISDDSFINSSDFNRDDLIIFTENSTWVLKYTGNDAVPVELNKLDNSRGTLAPYGTISYLNLTTGESPRGFIGCDGYSVERADNKIPRFSFEEIDLQYFNLCNAGTIDEDRDHYLIYPSVDSSSPTEIDDNPSNTSDRILITNYEESNYSIYRIPLSCMGNFASTESVTWDDLSIFDSWEEMALRYSTWDSFIYQMATPIGIGGGHEGQIISLNEAQSEDYPVAIRNVTGSSSADVTLTTDFQNFQPGDIIYLTGLTGSVELNNTQGQVTAWANNYQFTVSIDTTDGQSFPFSAYTPNTGFAAKVINFQTVTKKFNPFAEQDKKVRCGWVYFYVTTTGTNLFDQEGNPIDAILKVQVIVNDQERPTTLTVPNGTFYQVNLTDHTTENGIKKWYKIWVNQTGRFIQLAFSNQQAGAKVQIHAVMPGFASVGRLV